MLIEKNYLRMVFLKSQNKINKYVQYGLLQTA